MGFYGETPKPQRIFFLGREGICMRGPLCCVNNRMNSDSKIIYC